MDWIWRIEAIFSVNFWFKIHSGAPLPPPCLQIISTDVMINELLFERAEFKCEIGFPIRTVLDPYDSPIGPGSGWLGLSDWHINGMLATVSTWFFWRGNKIDRNWRLILDPDTRLYKWSCLGIKWCPYAGTFSFLSVLLAGGLEVFKRPILGMLFISWQSSRKPSTSSVSE